MKKGQLSGNFFYFWKISLRDIIHNDMYIVNNYKIFDYV